MISEGSNKIVMWSLELQFMKKEKDKEFSLAEAEPIATITLNKDKNVSEMTSLKSILSKKNLSETFHSE